MHFSWFRICHHIPDQKYGTDCLSKTKWEVFHLPNFWLSWPAIISSLGQYLVSVYPVWAQPAFLDLRCWNIVAQVYLCVYILDINNQCNTDSSEELSCSSVSHRHTGTAESLRPAVSCKYQSCCDHLLQNSGNFWGYGNAMKSELESCAGNWIKVWEMRKQWKINKWFGIIIIIIVKMWRLMWHRQRCFWNTVHS